MTSLANFGVSGKSVQVSPVKSQHLKIIHSFKIEIVYIYLEYLYFPSNLLPVYKEDIFHGLLS